MSQPQPSMQSPAAPLVVGIGLSDADMAALRGGLGASCRLDLLPELPASSQAGTLGGEKPVLALTTLSHVDRMSEEQASRLSELATNRVLVLDQDRPLDPEDILSAGYLSAMRSPIDPDKVRQVLERAGETQGMFDDVMRLAREISLEREVLTRKMDQLMFMNQLMSHASETLDIGSILSRVRDDLSMLLDVSELGCVLWDPEAERSEAEVYLRPGLPSEERQAWTGLLLESMTRMGGKQASEASVSPLVYGTGASAKRWGEPKGPQEGRMITLPLAAQAKPFGCLALLVPSDAGIGKDQAQLLQSSAKLLSLTLKNGQDFNKVKNRADKDGLTKVYNRQSFDERLIEEMRRVQRYSCEVSVLLMDLDHFKLINDTHGHQAGDQVLRDTARLLVDTLRATDFVARYGGEEFVVILPHTGETQAWLLAERLRRRIARKRFSHAGASIRVTASFGVAGLKPGTLLREDDVVRLADQALYQAKASGRNMVCLSCDKEEQALEN